MTKRSRVISVALCAVIVAAGLCGWLLWPRDRLLRGKRESQWIAGISYNSSDEQTQQWRELGPDGLQVLARYLDRGRFYRKTYTRIAPHVPAALWPVLRHFPEPALEHPSRMCVIELLHDLGKDAAPVEPAIARALDDDDLGVRQIALACYEWGLFTANADRLKAARLPAFLRALKSPDWGIRNNAAVALQHYASNAPGVVPALANALQDSSDHVRLRAIESLIYIDPPAAIHAGAISVITNLMKDPDDQVALQAPELLLQLGPAAKSAEPALIECVQTRSNSVTAHFAAETLKKLSPVAAATAGIE